MTVTRTTRWGTTAVAAAASTLAFGALAAPVAADTPDLVDTPDTFTSAFIAEATPDAVIENPAGDPAGVEGAEGAFIFLVNSDEEVICWEISVTGLATDYQSAAKTSTHIHENAAGENGPPRLAFPNPAPADDTDPETVRTSSGCSEGPFTTGLTPEDGPDTGEGFELAQLEADLEAEAFSADTHTTDAVSGAVRGQLVFSQELLDAANEGDDDGDNGGDDSGSDADSDSDRQVPVGGVRTGEGGSASTLPLGLMAAFTIAGAGVVGAAALRRRQGA